MSRVSRGKRAGDRTRGSFQPALLGLAVACTLCVVAWGYLVYAAIDFGTTARGGDSASWWWLGLASAGAVACLFLALILVARMSRRLGITQAPPPRPPRTKRDPDAPPSGRRSAR